MVIANSVLSHRISIFTFDYLGYLALSVLGVVTFLCSMKRNVEKSNEVKGQGHAIYQIMIAPVSHG
jgi:hypothetical protein